MQAQCHWEGAKAADGEGSSGKDGIEQRLYSPPAQMSFYKPCGDKFVDQAAQEKPYSQKGQYCNEIILKCDEELGYQLPSPELSAAISSAMGGTFSGQPKVATIHLLFLPKIIA